MREYFFGRERELELLRTNFFVRTPGPGFCGAINGPNDIGKTMLIRQAAREFEQTPHPNVYYFSTGIVAEGSYWQFWTSLIRMFAVRIPEAKLRVAPNPDPDFIQLILDAYQFFRDPGNLERMGTISFHSEAIDHLNFIFLAYTQLGIHILITIDEFDNARTAFPVDGGDGSFFQRLYMLSPKSSSEYNLSILLISRKRISTIAHHMADGSDIESAFPPFIILRGFSNREMEDYFASYQELLPQGLSQEQREEIYYFCGRHPGLLMKMRALFQRHYDPSVGMTPGDLYREYGQEMTVLYERMNSLLRTEFVDGEKKRNCVGVFSQVFIGPAYDVNLTSRLDQLHKYGLLSKWDKSGKNIFQLAGLPYEDEAERRFDYEPMSPYYIEFFKARVLPEDMDALTRLMTTAEQDVRAGILAVLKAMFPDTWESVLEQYTSTSKQHYRVKLDLIAYQNDADIRNVTYTNLDVLAYNDYFKIIAAYWPQMQPYFRSFVSLEQLETAFQYLNDCRNCFAHNNAKILDERSCSRLRNLCSALIEDYQRGESGEPAAETAQAAPQEDLPASPAMPSLQQIQELLNHPGTIVFCYQEKKKPKGNLRGVIKGYNYPAGISKMMLSGFGPQFAPAIGDEFEARVERWASNAGLFNLEAP